MEETRAIQGEGHFREQRENQDESKKDQIVAGRTCQPICCLRTLLVYQADNISELHFESKNLQRLWNSLLFRLRPAFVLVIA